MFVLGHSVVSFTVGVIADAPAPAGRYADASSRLDRLHRGLASAVSALYLRSSAS